MFIILIFDFTEEHGLLEDAIHGLLCIFKIQNYLSKLGDKSRKTTTCVPRELKVCHAVKSDDCSPLQVICAFIIIEEGSEDTFTIFGILKLTDETQGIRPKNPRHPYAVDKLVLGFINIKVSSFSSWDSEVFIKYPLSCV